MKTNKRIILILIGFVLFVFGVWYLYYFRPIVDDELFNYGFAKSILDGRIPYLDFNMIIPPLFPILLSLVLGIFGEHLLVYHFLLVLFSLLVCYIAYLKIGYKAIALYALILIYPYTGYNTFCLFLFMLLLYVADSDYKNKDLLEAIIISCMFLSKQTLGLLVIPSVVSSRHKKKVISVYAVSILLLVLYLLFKHNMFQFIDYCVLGMFNFASKNSNFSGFFIAEIFVIIFLLFDGVKTKRKDVFYLLCFQIIAFPIPNYIHFLIAFIPALYYLFICFKKNFIGTIFFMGFSIAFFIIFSLANYFVKFDYNFLSNYPVNNFMKGRISYSATSSSIYNMSIQLEKYSDYDVYVLGSFSYLVKLNLDMPIDKYDIINSGNMGYGGADRYIDEIDNKCKSEKCLFIINDAEALGKVHNQVDRSILKYVINHYYQEYSSDTFSIYVNKKQLF